MKSIQSLISICNERIILVLQLILATLTATDLYSVNVGYFGRNQIYTEVSPSYFLGLIGFTAILWLKEKMESRPGKAEFLRYQTISMILAITFLVSTFVSAIVRIPPQIGFVFYLLFQCFSNFYLLLIYANGLEFLALGRRGAQNLNQTRPSFRASVFEQGLSCCICILMVIIANLMTFRRLLDGEKIPALFNVLPVLGVAAAAAIGWNWYGMCFPDSDKREFSCGWIYHLRVLCRELKLIQLIALLVFTLFSKLRLAISNYYNELSYFYLFMVLFVLTHVLTVLADRFDYVQARPVVSNAAPLILRIFTVLVSLIMTVRLFLETFRFRVTI